MTPFDPNRSRWIPWVFVGGMGVVVLVNLVLVFAALSSFTGVTVGQSYDRGRAYNQVLDAAQRQQALGWSAAVALQDGALSVVVRDREGLPVPGRIEGVLQRPLERKALPLDFTSPGTGRFRADIAPGQPGQWEARLTLHGPGQQTLDIRQRVIAP